MDVTVLHLMPTLMERQLDPAAAYLLEKALAARDAGRLTLPLKGHGWLYEVISNWRPQAGQVVTTGESRQVLPKTASKTLSAIAALEDRARG